MFGPKTGKMEKQLLRKAFSSSSLPHEVLWRKKEAFSDGVSSVKRSWLKLSKSGRKRKFRRRMGEAQEVLSSKEAFYYKKIFDQHYTRLHSDNVIPHYWLPAWSGKSKEPSARVPFGLLILQ